jgi:hypothetical protein
MVIRLSTLLPSLSRFFIPSQSLLIWRFVRRVNLTTRLYDMFKPIFDYTLKIILFKHTTLGSPYKIMNLAFNAIAVSAKHSTDFSCFVVVVKARHDCA